MKKLIALSIPVLAIFLFANSTWKGEWEITGETPVAEVLDRLGDIPAPHLVDANVEGVTVERGRDIVLQGRTHSPYGGKSERVSKHFVCTSCHNVERDEPDLALADPEARLEYVHQKGLPFLQGSALYGIVDRRLFYNGDYDKKYGDLVKDARNDLRESIHLCATECAQGRPLEDWEMESVLAYLWTIGLKMDDLDLSEDELEKIEKAGNGKAEKEEAMDLVKSKYLLGMPATFLDPPADRRAGFSQTGNVDRGKKIYELSCLHCHERQRYSFFNLDKSEISFEFLDKHFPTYSRYSVYQVSRYGTSPIPWKRAYMPHYTKEKMSEQMLEDLRTYIEQEAK
jgi:cytochrome c